jgi:ribosomal-protein-alanine N-acetyltransferase
MELTTTRLVLRPYAEGDLDAVHAYGSCPENVRYMIWGPNTEKETAEFLAECLSRQGEVPRLKHDFAITLRENGRLIGGCGIYLDKEQTEGMLGWILHRDFWGHGYVPEAAQALMYFGFDTLRLHRVWASCNAENTASWRVMEKCGMRREARFVKARFGRVGEERRWYDEFRYALLREEWGLTAAARGRDGNETV